MRNRRRIMVFGLTALVVTAVGLAAYILRGASQLSQPTPFANPEFEIAEDYQRLKAASRVPLELVHDEGFPRNVMGRIPVEGDTLVEKARNYLDEYRAFYRQSDPDLELEVLRSTSTSVVFYQTYQGIQVYGSELVVMIDGASIIATIGRLMPSGVEVDISPGLAPQDALKPAAAELGLRDPAIRGIPRLVIFDPGVVGVEGEREVLAWQLMLEADRPLELVLDAADGKILREIDRFEGQGSLYALDLRDALSTNSWATSCYSASLGYETKVIGNEDGLFLNYDSDAEAVAGWQLSQVNWNYYLNNYGLASYDGLGGTVAAYIRSNTLGTASFSPDCNLIQFTEGAINPDTYAHEFSHWVDAYHANLIYQDESGALDESFADINGAMLDGNWLVGENGPDGPIRDMSNPNAYNSPDHLDEFYGPGQCPSFGSDNGCVHYNSGIPNFVAYLLAEGGTHPDSGVPVESIGKGPVGLLHFMVMTTGVPSNAVFLDARSAAISIAEATWGLETACKVQNAWYAVGIGQADFDCDGMGDSAQDSDDDGFIDTLDNCPEGYNPDQTDYDGDGVGLLCDPDDNLANPYILCPTPGVECDTEDWDADGILNPDDNCVFTPNPDQADVDNDGDGDACDPDSDGDGISDNDDNCINTPNPDQANADGDFAGDLCDPTPNCDDVYAWSSVNTIPVGEEGIQTEPQPIFNPFACLPDMAIDGVPWLEKEPEIDPDGGLHWIEVIMDDNPYQTLPLPICGPDSPEGSPSDNIQTIRIEDSSFSHLMLVNDFGEIKDGITDTLDPINGEKELTFIPRGGESYYLLLDRGDLSPGTSAHLGLRIDCTPRQPSKLIQPPRIGDPIIRPEMTATPSESPTLRVSPTPAPSDTLEPTPSDTARPSPEASDTSTPRPSPPPVDTPRSRLPTATPGGRSN